MTQVLSPVADSLLHAAAQAALLSEEDAHPEDSSARAHLALTFTEYNSHPSASALARENESPGPSPSSQDSAPGPRACRTGHSVTPSSQSPVS